MHSQDTAELSFTDVRVPLANLLGEENQGFFQLVAKLPQERMSIAVAGVAEARAAFENTLRYVQERSRVRAAHRIVPALAIRPRRDRHRDRRRPDLRRPMRRRSQRRRALRRRCGQGQVVGDRAAGPGRRPMRATAWRLRLHARVPRRPGLHRRSRDPHLRRDHGDHEGRHRQSPWVCEPGSAGLPTDPLHPRVRASPARLATLRVGRRGTGGRWSARSTSPHSTSAR